MSADEQAIVERLFVGTVTALEMLSVALGDRLGLYTALRDAGAMTAGEFAQRASIQPRARRPSGRPRTPSPSMKPEPAG